MLNSWTTARGAVGFCASIMSWLARLHITSRSFALAVGIAAPLVIAISPVAACGGATQTQAASDAGPLTSSLDGATFSDAATTADATTTTTPQTEAEALDGPATRNKCTDKLGSGLTALYGRLDGTLVSIVPITDHDCNGDSSHVHLQVLMSGGIYDIAVNTDGLAFQLDHTLPGKPWTEGWDTTVTLDYPTDLGIHDGSFATTNTDALLTSLENVNHITIFATGYGFDGAHLVHRNGTKQDGALVLDPLSPVPHFLVFCFTGDSF